MTVLQQKTGLKANTGPLFFSPFGAVHGKELYLSGTLAGHVVTVKIGEYKISPKENLLVELWNQQDSFDLKNLHYDLWLKNVIVENQGEGAALQLKLGELAWNEGNLKIHLEQVYGVKGDKEIHCEEMNATYQKKIITTQVRNIAYSQKQAIINCGVVQIQGRWEDDFLKPSSSNIFDRIMYGLEDVRMVDIQGKLGEETVTQASGRLLRTSIDSWTCSLQCLWKQWPLVANFQLERSKDKYWSLAGWQNIEVYQKRLHYFLGGQLNLRGPWRVSFYDDAENKIEFDITWDSILGWVGTWSADMKQIPMLNDTWPSISGRFDGGISWNDGDARLILKGKNIQGGPGKTRDGYIEAIVVYSLDKHKLFIDHLLVGEDTKWKGFVKGIASLEPLKLEALQCEVDKFPLGQYSPKVSGVLDINAYFEDSRLDVQVRSEALFPDNDPLQKLEKLNVSVQVDEQEIHYRQAFQQQGDENIIKVYAKVDKMLTDPMKIRDGMLTKLESSSQLFELRLQESVPVRINAEGIEVQSFHIDDLNLRLRNLKGHAYIPFIMPSRLLIEAKGDLDLGKMPPIGENRLNGQVKIYRARWDRGWSIGNIDVSWMGDKIELLPAGLLENLDVSMRGTMSNHIIAIEQGEGKTALNGKITVSGNYNMGARNLDLSLTAEKLNFYNKDYSFVYNCPAFRVEGDPFALAMSGNITIDRFLYSGDFAMMGDREKSSRHRLEIRPPESLDVRHQLNLDVLAGHNMEINNNAAQLKFNIDQLKIRGPVSSLHWKGVVEAQNGKNNRVILPFQWLDVSFQTKNLQLVFDDEDRWDPNIHLEAETQVDGVQVFLLYDDKMSNLGAGKFKLSSSPSYTRKEILALLGSGEEPVKEVFAKTSGDETAQEAGPSFTLIKSRGKRNAQQSLLNYSAGVTSGDAPFEFRVDYRLGQHLGLEATQTATNGVFMGLRYSKQISKLSELIQREDLVDQTKDETEVKVVWKFSGIPMGQSLGLCGGLTDALSKVEDPLKRGEYENARQQITTILEEQLASSGYLSGQCEVKVISKNTQLLDKRDVQRENLVEKIVVEINFKLGAQWSLSEVTLKNWPKNIEIPQHEWLREPHFRAALISKAEMLEFKNLLITTLVDRGYPSAEISELTLEPILNSAPENVMDIHPNLVNAEEVSDRWKYTLPHRLVINLHPGELHHIVQFIVEGEVRAEMLDIEKVVGYTDNMIYSEAVIDQFPEKLKKWYEQHGYFGTSVIISQILKSRRYPKISIHLKVEEGDRWQLGKISYEGVVVSDLDYLRTVTGLEEDTPANPEKLAESIAKLSRLQQLTSVNYRWIEREEGKKDLVIEVKESPAWRFATRLGMESDRGLQLALRVRRGNLFGRGESISFENNFAQDERNHLLRYEVPDIFNKDWRGQLLLGYQVDLLSNREIVNKTLVTGLSLFHEVDKRSWGCDLVYREDKNIEGDFPSIRLKSVIRSSSVALPKQPGRGWGWNIKNQLIDYLDSQNFAVVGEYSLSYGFKFGTSMLTPWSRVGNYWPLGGAEQGLPFADRFFLGGTGSLRGFKNNSISGPKDRGGESFSSYGVELFYPMFQWVDGSLFYEWGKIYDQPYLVDGAEPRKSIGMGVIFRTPVGPIEGYFAHPLGEARLGTIGLQLGTIF